MTPTEFEILQCFQEYRVRSGQILFVQCASPKFDAERFERAISSLVQRGLVLPERRHGAYSLTKEGYRAAKRLDVRLERA
jgi:predicted transcriptional regulator